MGPGGLVVKHPPANAGDIGWIRDLGKSHVHGGVTKPVGHNCWTCALELEGKTIEEARRALEPPALQQEKPHAVRSHLRLEGSPAEHSQRKALQQRKTQHSQGMQRTSIIFKITNNL